MTYSNNIRFEDMLIVRHDGLRLIASHTAAQELFRYGIDLTYCLRILKDGYEPRRRAKGTIESWLDSGKKTWNIVIVKDFNRFYDEEVYLITHIGRFTNKGLKDGKR